MNDKSTFFSLIPLSSITILDDYILTFHKKNLCDTIRVTQLMMPVVVKKSGERYVLIDGYDRLRCAKELGWKEIPALVVEDERVDVLRLALNYVRGRVCGVDVLLYVWQLSQQYDVSLLAKILGREYETIRKYRAAAEALLALGLSRDDFAELHNQCISLRKLLRCAHEVHGREELYACLAYKPAGKKVTAEAVRKAVKLEKDPQMKEALDIVELLGKDKVEKLAQIWDLARKTVCARMEQYKHCLMPEDYRLLELICQ